MIVCTHCQAKNSLDSLFCKSCGREVTEADREQAREANAKLIAEGYSLLAEGRTEEAELVARAGIEADPKAGGAYSLLGMCFERKDDIVAALECYETVVELNPDSALDKIKVTQMRNVLARRSEPEAEPNRKVAVFAAAAAVLLVGVTGAIVAVMSRDGATNEKLLVQNGTNPTIVAQNPGKAFDEVPGELKNLNPDINAGTQQQQQQTQTNPQTDPGNGQSQDNGQRPNPGRGSDSTQRYTFPPRSGENRGLPEVGEGRESDEQIPPVTLDLEPRRGTDPGTVNQNPTGRQSDQNDPAPVGGGGGQTGPAAEPKKPGQITITPHGGNRNAGAGGGQFIDDDPQSTRNNGNGLKAVVKSAREQMQVGSYDSAARAFERARQMGGDNGSVSKNLAICYEKIGKRNDAIQAYRSAKKHLESSNDPAAKSQLDTVNQALKNLGG